MSIFEKANAREEKTLLDFALLCGLVLYHYTCHSLMLIPVLLNERLPAPHLPDLVIDNVPFVKSVADINYYLWIGAYIIPALYLFYKNKRIFYRFMVLGGVVSLARGFIIPLTRLGPVMGTDVNAVRGFDFWNTWLAIVNPWQAVVGNAAGVYLTKDLFFSGHVATTFLLFLYSRKLGKVSYFFLAANVLTVFIVFLSHLHYTIDVIGAYAIVYCIFILGDRFLREKCGM